MYLDRAKELVAELSYIVPSHIYPCNAAQIQWMARMLGVMLPAAYEEFLAWAGNGLGDVMVGSEFYFKQLMLHDYRAYARDLLTENDLDNSILDAHTIIISSHQGYQFAYIRDDEGENPPVYQYVEGAVGYEEVKRIAEQYSDYLEMIIINSERFADLLSFKRIEDLSNLSQPIARVRDLHNGGMQFAQLPDKLFEFVNLEALDLRFSKLQSLSPRISVFSKLKRLELQGNLLTELPSEISSLKNLEILYIANNRITTVIEHLRHLPKLQFCYLDGNPISATEIAQIRQEFPNLKLQFL